MKKALIKTVVIVILGVIWRVAYTWGKYLLDMKYSTDIATSQLNDETSSYQWMRNFHLIRSGIDWLFFAGVVALVIWLFIVWYKRSKENN